VIVVLSAVILLSVLVIFTLGKSPFFRVDRVGAAIIGASLTVATGVLSFDEAIKTVDYRTVVLLFSMMIVTAHLNLSGFFQLIANHSLIRLQTKRQLLLAVIVTVGLLSAFFINDVVCLLFTPIVISISQRAGLNPVPYLLGVALASNIGSAATLIGNPQNIYIGSVSPLSFAWYMAVALPLSLFGLILTYTFISRVYQAELEGPLPEAFPVSGAFHPYLIKKGLVVVGFILAGFLTGFNPAVVASLGAAFLLLTRRVKPAKVYAGIDFNLLVIFIGLFVIIGGVEHSGLLVRLINPHFIGSFLTLPVFAILTVLLSNIVSNVPAVMLLKFFIPSNDGYVWWAAMAVFSTLAGNLTLTGSIANLIVVELAKKKDIEISFSTYLKIGFPLTVTMIIIGLVYFKMLFGPRF